MPSHESIRLRAARQEDFPAFGAIRALRSGTKEYWTDRIERYAAGQVHPQQALLPRALFVATVDNEVAGFIAGHLTRRFGCEGELQWIDTLEAYRRRGIASCLLREMLAGWFLQRNARSICVDPGDERARRFYIGNGAQALNEHWLYWPDIGAIATAQSSPSE